MNSYIPVLDEIPPAGFVCNATLQHYGCSIILGHTPPREMEIICPCLDCLVSHLEASMEAAGVDPGRMDEALDGFVLGPVWFGHDDPYRKPEEMVGVYRRARMKKIG